MKCPQSFLTAHTRAKKPPCEKQKSVFCCHKPTLLVASSPTDQLVTQSSSMQLTQPLRNPVEGNPCLTITVWLGPTVVALCLLKVKSFKHTQNANTTGPRWAGLQRWARFICVCSARLSWSYSAAVPISLCRHCVTVSAPFGWTLNFCVQSTTADHSVIKNRLHAVTNVTLFAEWWQTDSALDKPVSPVPAFEVTI